jgi:large subunit ribosomal protein L24e
MPPCSFCKKVYEIPRGITYILTDGKILHFCSSKCQKNHALKRDPKKVNWVKRPKKVKEEKIESSN